MAQLEQPAEPEDRGHIPTGGSDLLTRMTGMLGVETPQRVASNWDCGATSSDHTVVNVVVVCRNVDKISHLNGVRGERAGSYEGRAVLRHDQLIHRWQYSEAPHSVPRPRRTENPVLPPRRPQHRERVGHGQLRIREPIQRGRPAALLSR